MAYPKVKGSFILKLFVILSAVSLGVALYIPNTLWNLERDEEIECHFRMEALVDIQTQYAATHEMMYADSIGAIIEAVNTDTVFRALCDSLVQMLHDLQMAENIKTDKPPRLYHNVPVTVDSVFRCPSTGLLYNITSEKEREYMIVCPTEDSSIKVHYFFKKENFYHGSISHTKDKSW